MTYQEKRGVYIFKKDGVYFSLTASEINEMQELLDEITKEEDER